MVTHIVLFRPRPDITRAEGSALAAALSRALREIPAIRHARIGRRVTHGRAYEQLMREDYEYAVVLDFDDVETLRAYLRHPAHEELAQRFFASFEAALMYDYEMSEGEAGIASVL